jgi:hypothetical protein
MAVKKKCLLAGMLALIVLPLAAAPDAPLAVGVYSGGSLDLGAAFAWSEYGNFKYDLTFHLGGYLQYDLSPDFALQLDMNYQWAVWRWNWRPWQQPEKSGKNKFSFPAFNLNGVFTFTRSQAMQVYLIFGGGLNTVRWSDFDGIYFNVMGGAGMKVRVKPGSRVHFIIGATFHHLLDRNKYNDLAHSADYLRLAVGLEFRARDHGAPAEER